MTVKVTVPSSTFQKAAGVVFDDALSAPVGITRRGRVTHVLLSASEYERLKLRDRQVIDLADLPEEELRAALQPMEPGHEHLNAELES